MDISQFNPFVRYIDRRKYITEYPEFLLAYDHRFFYSIDGVLKIFVNDSVYYLNKNEALIIPPAMPYKLMACPNLEFFILNFDFIYKNTSPTPISPEPERCFDKNKIFETVTSKNFPMFLICPSDTKNYIEEIYNAYIKKTTLYSEYMSAELKRIIINSIIATEYDKTPDLIKKVCAYLNKNYLKSLTNTEIAFEFSYHPNYINRIFKESMGKTIQNYITELKISDAKHLLRTTDLNIGEICEVCGFESYSYFIKKFRTYVGISPLKYRKQNSLHL